MSALASSKLFSWFVFHQEKQELGERVMVTRLHLFNKWVKVSWCADLHCNPMGI